MMANSEGQQHNINLGVGPVGESWDERIYLGGLEFHLYLLPLVRASDATLRTRLL